MNVVVDLCVFEEFDLIFDGCGDMRVVIVVGNGDYLGLVFSLFNDIVNDVNVVVMFLQCFGFLVIKVLNMKVLCIENYIFVFERVVIDVDVVFFYYSGYGFQIGDQNVIFLVDVCFDLVKSFGDYVIIFQDVLLLYDDIDIEVGFIFLDVCRDFLGIGFG